MQQTKRLVFDVSDLRVLMRCPDCKIELSFRPETDQRVPMGCPNCKSTWNLGDHKVEQAWQRVHELRSALHIIAKGQFDSDMFGIQMEIELSG